MHLLEFYLCFLALKKNEEEGAYNFLALCWENDNFKRRILLGLCPGKERKKEYGNTTARILP